MAIAPFDAARRARHFIPRGVQRFPASFARYSLPSISVHALHSDENADFALGGASITSATAARLPESTVLLRRAATRVHLHCVLPAALAYRFGTGRFASQSRLGLSLHMALSIPQYP